MAGRKAGSPSRSDFIRKQLASKPESKLAEVNEAWKKAGNSGEITATLFYQVKSKAGHVKRTGARRGRPPGRPAGSGATKSSSGGYASIEATLDSLIATAEGMGDRSLAESLRTTRRIVSAKLV